MWFFRHVNEYMMKGILALGLESWILYQFLLMISALQMTYLCDNYFPLNYLFNIYLESWEQEV